MSDSSAIRAAKFLAQAFVDRRRIDSLPAELMPQTLSEAYEVQHQLVANLGGVGGWKLTLPAEDIREPSCAAVSVAQLRPSLATFRHDEFASPVQLEVELSIWLKNDLPPRSILYSKADVEAAVGSVAIALEIIGSRFTDRKSVGNLSTLADCQSCGAIVVGGAIGAFSDLDLSKAPLRLYINGELALANDSSTSNNRTMQGLVWLANHASASGLGLTARQPIITGARIKSALAAGENAIVATCDWGASVSSTFGVN